MRRMIVVVVLGIVILGAGWSAPKGKGGEPARQVEVSAPDSCVCYCKSTKYYPGASACMGGWQMQCRDRSGDGRSCGWDNMKNARGEDIRCNGEC
jgi:hypothetical protein